MGRGVCSHLCTWVCKGQNEEASVGLTEKDLKEGDLGGQH